jgi:hypothetical protein
MAETNGKEEKSSKASEAARSGIGFGACLAMVISWSIHKSVLWAIIHGLFGWLYVLWYVLFSGN